MSGQRRACGELPTGELHAFAGIPGEFDDHLIARFSLLRHSRQAWNFPCAMK
jgi:hypothetical protein